MKNNGITELEKSKAYIIVEIIEYMPNAVVSKTIIKKITGTLSQPYSADGFAGNKRHKN